MCLRNIKMKSSPKTDPFGTERRRFRIGRRALYIYGAIAAVVLVVNLGSFFFREDLLHVARTLGGYFGTAWIGQDGEEVEQDVADPFSEFQVPGYDPLIPFAFRMKPVNALALDPPYHVDSSALFRADDVTIQLAYISGLGKTDLCVTTDERKFPCGLMGRASLQNWISNQKMTCKPVFYPVLETRFSCFLEDGSSLSEHQVLSGFARPDAFAQEVLNAPLARAKAARAGVWAGDWQVVTLESLKNAAPALESPDR